jgi:hypothetical protein
VRFDFSVFKNFKVTERVALKFQADVFNLFHYPSFDAPNTNFELDPCFNPQPCFHTQPVTKESPNPSNFGVIRQTVGSNRFMQLSLTSSSKLRGLIRWGIRLKSTRLSISVDFPQIIGVSSVGSRSSSSHPTSARDCFL